MIRRSFLAALAGLVGELFGARPAQAKPKNPEQFKRVFRHDGTAWKEIQWEEIRKGDCIVSIGIFDGVLTDIDCFECSSDYRPEIKGVDCASTTNHLPRIWGNPRGHEVQISRGVDGLRDLCQKSSPAIRENIDAHRHWCFQNGVMPGPELDRR